MKLALTSFVFSLLAVSSAHAEEAKECSNAPLMRVLNLHRGAGGIEVKAETERITLVSPKTNSTLLEVSCNDIKVGREVLPSKPEAGKRAQVNAFEWGVVSRTASEGVSIDFNAGSLHRKAVSFLLLDDGSHTLTREEEMLYSISTEVDGALVVREGWGLGCGCERRTSVDGTISTRALPRPVQKR